MLAQRTWLMILNKRKEQLWERMSIHERIHYQEDVRSRERDGNKRLEFRFRY
jgi:hypothetical protein